MHLENLGTLVWIVLVAIGVVSSMAKSARKARGPGQPAPRAAAPHPQGVVAQFGSLPVMPGPQTPPPPPPVLAAVPPPIIVRRAEPPRPAAVGTSGAALAAGHGTAPARGMFGRRADLVRAVIAAQVLGPPKALQEHTFWSPRHDEASI